MLKLNTLALDTALTTDVIKNPKVSCDDHSTQDAKATDELDGHVANTTESRNSLPDFLLIEIPA